MKHCNFHITYKDEINYLKKTIKHNIDESKPLYFVISRSGKIDKIVNECSFFSMYFFIT